MGSHESNTMILQNSKNGVVVICATGSPSNPLGTSLARHLRVNDVLDLDGAGHFRVTDICGAGVTLQPVQQCLPSGWTEYKDAEGNALCYNASTRETSPQRPFRDNGSPYGKITVHTLAKISGRKVQGKFIHNLDTRLSVEEG